MGTHPIFESDFDCLTDGNMTHTARKRKREQKRRKIGLSGKVRLDEDVYGDVDDGVRVAKEKYKQEEINLEHSQVKNVTLLTILAADKAFSASMATVSQNSRFLCLLFHLCEAAGHGVLWLAGCVYVLWKSKPSSPVYEVTFNLVYALLLDIIIVGLLKNAFKRRRPSGGESRGDIGPDAYSFPSGHSSRAVLISLFIQHVFRFRASLPWRCVGWFAERLLYVPARLLLVDELEPSRPDGVILFIPVYAVLFDVVTTTS